MATVGFNRLDRQGLADHVGHYQSTAAAFYEIENDKVRNAWLVSFATDYVLQNPQNDQYAVPFEQLVASNFKALPSPPGDQRLVCEPAGTSSQGEKDQIDSVSDSSSESDNDGLYPGSEEEEETDDESFQRPASRASKVSASDSIKLKSYTVEEVTKCILNRPGRREGKRKFD